MVQLNYGLDLDKVLSNFEEVKNDQAKLVNFSKDIIPKLITELRQVRMEVVKALLGELPFSKSDI